MKRAVQIVFFMALMAHILFSCYAEEAVDTRGTIEPPQPGFVQILITNDGSKNIGRVVRIDGGDVTFQTEYGAIELTVESIKNIKSVPVESIRKGQYWHPDPNTTRLYFAPTARMLPKGRGYVADYYLFFPSLNYGISDRVSVGGGLSLLPTGSMREQIYFLTPKVSIKQTERFAFAAGILTAKFPDSNGDDDSDDDDERTPLASILYGVGTYGGEDSNLTLGLGYGMLDTDFAEKPMVVFGGKHRMSRRTAFITENWVFPGLDNAFVSYGVRFFGEELSLDLAFLNMVGEDAIFPGVPYIDFVYNFGE